MPDVPDTLEWQIAGGSKTAHVIVTNRAWPKRSGPESVCGRRPQRYYRPWFELDVNAPDVIPAIRGYACIPCPDCDDWLRAYRAR